MSTRSNHLQLKTIKIDDTDLPAAVFLLFFFFLLFFLLMQHLDVKHVRPNRYQRPRQVAGYRRHGTPPPIPRSDPRRILYSRIARETLEAVDNGYIDELIQNVVYRHSIALDVNHCLRGTAYYPDNSVELRHWRSQHHPGGRSPSKLAVLQLSTVEGAQYLHQVLLHARPHNAHIGVLNFASATKPGGGFIHGAIAQEESIARSSSLYKSLSSRTAKPFYESHKRDDQDGLYTHSMIYSPTVDLFRKDDGSWMKPIRIEVVTSPAVNAGLVRKKLGRHNSRQHRSGAVYNSDGGMAIETVILEVMQERMGRILALFELHGVKNLVLGSFGTGVFQNDIGMVSEIWKELLVGSHARFSSSFDRVLFAIPDRNTLDRFNGVFGPVSGF